jgi:hypothetical protein
MEGIVKGVRAICGNDDFVVEEFKDRFSVPTTSGWRDVLIVGRFKDPRAHNHLVEIQFHHEKMASMHMYMGGHKIYAVYRSLKEALKVTFGKFATEEFLDAHAQQVY